MRVRVLLISADAVFAQLAKKEAHGLSLDLVTAPSRQHAERLFGSPLSRFPDAVLIDTRGADSVGTQRWAYGMFPDAHVATLSGTTGADDLRRVLEQSTEDATLGAAGMEGGGLEELIGRSVRFREALDQAMQAASDPDIPVLITGEKGTGKRLFARVIHVESAPAPGPYVRIDCRALTGRALDLALQGQGLPAGRSSAATVCTGRRGVGGGTLLLEEISALDASRQERVLRFLTERHAGHGMRGDAPRGKPRIIATTAKDLGEGVRRGTFRAELLSRLGKFKIELPPLRERPSDILLLAERFMERKAARADITLPPMGREVQEHLLSHPWPGNIRELFGVLDASLEAARGADEVGTDHLPDWLLVPDAGERVPSHLTEDGATDDARARLLISGGGVLVELPEQGVAFEEIEKAILSAALEKTGHNVVRAARLLRLGRGSLRYRLEKYGLVEPRRRRSAKRRPARSEDEETPEVLKRAS